ncbi:MAG: nuclear transport factor 2 family protein [Candidatus Parcubacteria bacterium]|nr:nuclear transport factor 2 family protein [Burkholderiales bacterium]
MSEKHAANLRDQPVVHGMTRDSLGEGGRLVWDFLSLFAERHYAEANAYLVPGCRMLFPGGMVFTDCTELPKRASAIYQWVKKVFERIDEFTAADGVVVYNYGTLRGQWVDGEAFDGVRYIDRFLIRGGKIADQKVWNDLAVVAAARRSGGGS